MRIPLVTVTLLRQLSAPGQRAATAVFAVAESWQPPQLVGLSKIASVVDVFAGRQQVQERLTNQIADALMKTLHAHGVAVVMEASHTYMMMRCVQ